MKPPRRLSIFGATGSIGQSTRRVIEADPSRFDVDTVTAAKDWRGLAAIATALDADHAVILDEAAGRSLSEALAGSGTNVAWGASALIEAAERPVDLFVAAIVGAAGVRPTATALRNGAVVALANKECLVCAGAAFMALAKAHDATVLPLDSEHHGVFKLLHGRDRRAVERVVLTASGGPFRTWDKNQIARASSAQALAHPTWSMGAKISIDSASLMNKGLELIEAHHLFALPAERLSVIVHPQSRVHALVEMCDGSMLAELSDPDMSGPIATSLYWPDHSDWRGQRLDLAELGSLTFEEPDIDRFPSLQLARRVLEQGGGAPTILNAANEVAVHSFLAGEISFGRIVDLVRQVLDEMQRESEIVPASVDDALQLDAEARDIATRRLHPRRQAAN